MFVFVPLSYMMHKALRLLDSEKNDLTKTITNLAPLDGVIASVRARTRENEKVSMFETTVEDLLKHNSFKELSERLKVDSSGRRGGQCWLWCCRRPSDFH